MSASQALAPIELLGVPVRLRSNDREVAQHLSRCYEAALTKDAGGVECLEAELLRGERSWHVDVAGRERRVAEDSISAVRSLNHELVHGVMLRAPHLYYVHAGVVAVDGQALVLPGLSRAGKSTLVLALIEEGARFLSDELLAFDPRSRRALAFPRAIKIRDACVDYFSQLRPYFHGTGEGRFLSFGAFDRNVVSAPVPVKGIIVPTWTGNGREELTPVSSGRALLDLASSTLNFGTHRVRSLDCLAALVDDARTWRLAWSDPHAAARAILEAFGS